MSTALFVIGFFAALIYLFVAFCQAFVAVVMYNESGNTPKQKAEYRRELIRAPIWPLDALHKIQNTLHGR
jgi:hypothetical protein